ncbi:hypothetical protein TNCV_371071 [Trichonephila clavipes]|nr:hypothetical protein TNCV_371071 [Trichonephila clavipes]
MYIQDRFGSYSSIEWTKTDWNCTRYSIITCFAQTSDSLARLTQTLARMPDVMDMRERNINYTRAFGDGPRIFEPWSSDDTSVSSIQLETRLVRPGNVFPAINSPMPLRRGVKPCVVRSTRVHEWAFGSESPYQ